MKLHVGCGTVAIPGFVNVDIRYLPNVDVVDNAAYLRKFKDEDVEVIYACHVLEHFSRWDIPSILKRWYDLLNPTGVLFISVPDFESISSHYRETKDLKSLMGLLYGGQDYAENFHHIVWDFETLKADLIEAGFKQMCRYDCGTTFSYFDDYSKCYLPHMDSVNGRLMSLNVMADK